MIVVDTNIIAYLLITSDQTELAESVMLKDAEWAAPRLWRSELRNVLSRYSRQNLLTIDKAIELMQAAEATMAGREYDVLSDRVLQLALGSGCTSYDCEFVALAEQLEVTLVTSDKRLRNAFSVITVSMGDFVDRAF